ncbi:hypothetical protein [Frigidibacter sp. MR17.24]|uniref:hypothetical protein n=1 Tax=Frigidibacter sp. MR17.24 TaxID=3127345 RepID=UPI003012A584
MGRILKLVVFLVVLGFLGLTGYAYLGDLSPQRSEVRKPVALTPVPANVSQ